MIRVAKLVPAYCERPQLWFVGETGDGGASGEHGDDTSPGGPGGDATPGGPGEDLRIEADRFAGPGGRPLILAAIADDAGVLLRLVVHDPAKGTLEIFANGGPGGGGGWGGRGGACTAGGDGGNGAAGGRGGNVTLVLGDPALENAIRVAVSGGSGGPPWGRGLWRRRRLALQQAGTERSAWPGGSLGPGWSPPDHREEGSAHGPGRPGDVRALRLALGAQGIRGPRCAPARASSGKGVSGTSGGCRRSRACGGVARRAACAILSRCTGG